MAIVCIDPGTQNTGMVYMSEISLIACETIRGKTVGLDQDALVERAGEITRKVLAWIAGRPHDTVVLEGFVGYAGRQGVYTYQTPFLVGYLVRALQQAGENIVLQTSRQVLNPRSKGAVVTMADRNAGDQKAHALARSDWGGVGMLTNDHVRAAALHGIYYYNHR